MNLRHNDLDELMEQGRAGIAKIDDLARNCRVEIPEEIVEGMATAASTMAYYMENKVAVNSLRFMAAFFKNLYRAGYAHGQKDAGLIKDLSSN